MTKQTKTLKKTKTSSKSKKKIIIIVSITLVLLLLASPFIVVTELGRPLGCTGLCPAVSVKITLFHLIILPFHTLISLFH